MFQKNKNLKYIFILIGVLFVSFIVINIVLSGLLSSKQADLDKLYDYATKLEKNQPHYEVSNSSFDIATKVNTLTEINKALENLDDYENEVTTIEQNFEQEYQKFTEQLKTYEAKLDTKNILPELASIEFSSKKSVDSYFIDKYKSLREQVRGYNKSHNDKVIWKFDIDKELKVMSLDEKIGLLFILYSPGTQINNQTKELINSFGVSGLILMGDNIYSSNQLKKYTSQLQAESDLYPLFIATDQEGGPVKRLSWDSTQGAQYMGRNLSLEESCNQFKTRGKLLIDHGINVNFGLVGDITNRTSSFIYSRTFGSDANKVSGYIQQGVKCSGGTMQTIKHFPGHGRVDADTHKGIASYNLSVQEWKDTDGRIYYTAIDNGAEWIMMGHLKVDSLTNGKSASISNAAVDFLKKEMHFEGIIVTDDMNMIATNGRNPYEDLKSAVSAGIHQILYVGRPLELSKMKQAVKDLISDTKDDYSEEDLNNQVRKVLEYKYKLIK